MVTCPETARLHGVLNCTLPDPEQAAVVAHLDSCADCQVKLEQIAVAGSSVLVTAQSVRNDVVPSGNSAYWPALARVEQEIVVPTNGLATIEQPILPAVPERQRPKELDFLDPSIDDTKYLGSLDRFQLVEMVGRGGMGMVFRAFDACLERTVAIKVLDPQMAKNELAQQRFCREARATARVSHENVVTIHHVGEVEDRDLYYLVMQFVEGRSLQEILDTDGALTVREAVRIAMATASGLAAAHATNLIHRDIKPGNILIEKASGRVQLTDFGLARISENEKLTQTGYSPGTPLYMSPEQARGEPLDHHSDLFSLGGVMYAMLTGHPPFQGSSPFAVLQQVTGTEHPPIQQRNANVPDSLAGIIDRLLAKKPKDRFESAAEVAILLQQVLNELPDHASSTVPSSTSSTRLKPRGQRSWWVRRSPVLLATVLGLFGVGLISELAKVSQLTVLGQRDRVYAPQEEPETPTVYTLRNNDGAVWSVAFDPETKILATASESGSVKLWDAQSGESIGVLNTSRYKSPVWSAIFSKDGSKLATASDDGHVRMWDVRTKQETGVDISHPFGVRSVALSPDGKTLVSGTRNGAVTFWNADTGERIHATEGHDSGIVMSVAFSPDGKYAASTGSDAIVKIWDVATGSPRAALKGHQGPVYSVAFDPTNQLVASAGWDHKVCTWDVKKADIVNTFDLKGSDIWSVAFCPAGKHLICAGQDHTARWLNVDSGQVIATYHGHSGPLHAVAVSRDGKLIASGGRDGSVRVWKARY